MSALGSKKTTMIIGSIIVILVIWFGFRSISGFMGRSMVENAMERATGGKADVDMKSDGTMDITTEEGTFSAGTSVPKDWPTDVPTYAGASVTYSASTTPTDGKAGMALVLMTSDPAAAVKTYYESVLATNGWTVTNSMQGGGTVIMTAEKEGRTLSIAITEADGQTGITLGVEVAS